MTPSRYIVYSSYTAGLRFAEVARRRGHEVRVVCHETSPFLPLYQRVLPNLLLPFVDLQSEGIGQQIAAFEPDFLVSCVFDRKVPTAHFAMARREAVNVHPSRLPAIRTGDSSFWNIMLEDELFQLTMHRLTEQWDQGDILFSENVPLAPRETRLSLISKVERVMIERAHCFQLALEAGRYVARPQIGGACYPKPRDKIIRVSGAETAEYLDRLVRAGLGDVAVEVGFRQHTIRLVEVDPMPAASLRLPGTLTVVDEQLLLSTATRSLRLNVLHSDAYGTLSGWRFIEVFSPQAEETLVGPESAAALALRSRTEAGWTRGRTA